MFADKANTCITEIHHSVTSGQIDLDAKSMIRCLDMLKHMAEQMLSDQSVCNGDPCATKELVSALQNAELHIEDAIAEMREDVDSYARQQAALRAKYTAGEVLGPRLFEMI